MCIARHAQNTQSNKFATSQYLKENVNYEVCFLPADKHQRFLQIDTSIPKLPKITSLLFLYNILRNKGVMKFIFCMQISMKVANKLMLWFLWGWSSIPKVPKIASLQCFCHISKNKLDEVNFLHADKYQSFVQVDFNTLGIKFSCKVILSLVISMIKHSQSSQSNEFAISVQ